MKFERCQTRRGSGWSAINTFLRLYGRRAQKAVEPNDRRYDPEVEAYVKGLKPEDLGRLLHGDDDGRLPPR